jgi:hypothetical protein
MNRFARSSVLTFTQVNAVAPSFASIRLPVIIGLLTAGCASLAIYILSAMTGIKLSSLTRDPLDLTGLSPLTGLLSNLGAMVWAAATGICFVGAAIPGRDGRQHRFTRFLIFSGMLSLLFTVDDIFLIHDYFFPRYLRIRAIYSYAGYIIIVLCYFIYFFRFIFSTNYLLLAIGIFGLGTSLIVGVFIPSSNFQTFVEDSFKFLGIVFWLCYFANVVVLKAQLS